MALVRTDRRLGFYKQNPGTDVAVTQMIRKTTDKSRGIRLGNFVQIRTIVDEELEGVWNGKRSPRKRWTPPSSAATSSLSASRKPTRVSPDGWLLAFDRHSPAPPAPCLIWRAPPMT
jgi:hypothetical protein